MYSSMSPIVHGGFERLLVSLPMVYFLDNLRILILLETFVTLQKDLLKILEHIGLFLTDYGPSLHQSCSIDAVSDNPYNLCLRFQMLEEVYVFRAWDFLG